MLGCIRLMVTDNNIEPFHWQDWEPIEHFAAQGVIKDSIWTARMTRLGLKARIDIPVAGTMINVVNDRLQLQNPPNGWPITAESGWQEYHIKHLKKSLRTWPIPASTRLFLRAQQQHRHLNGTLPGNLLACTLWSFQRELECGCPHPRSGEIETTMPMSRRLNRESPCEARGLLTPGPTSSFLDKFANAYWFGAWSWT